MAMQMWLTRPWEFERLDQAINDACCNGELDSLRRWVTKLDEVVAGQPAAAGIGGDTGVFPGPGQQHFYKHWVGDFAQGVPPDYWPYAWGKWMPNGPDERLRLDRLMSLGLSWSIRKVIGANETVASADQWDHPACSSCRTHLTVWVCFELSQADQQLAATDLAYRKSQFRLGVVETRDAVVLVVKTPRPIELTGGVCDPKKKTEGEGKGEKIYREPVIVTEAFTAGETPRWTQPTTIAPTVTGVATLLDVEQQPLPNGGHMPKGTYPDDVDLCNFVSLPVMVDGIDETTSTSDLIKTILRGAAARPGFTVPGQLDLSDELIDRLRITIDDE